MYIILKISIINFNIIIEHFIFLFFKYNLNTSTFITQIQKLIITNNIDHTIKLYNTTPSTTLTQIIKTKLTHTNKNKIKIQNTIKKTTLNIIPQIQKHTNNLTTITNVTTLLNLLNTIFNIINTFKSLNQTTTNKHQKTLNKNISTTIYTTTFNLIITIPYLNIHIFLTNITKKIINKINQYSIKLKNLLISHNKNNTTNNNQ